VKRRLFFQHRGKQYGQRLNGSQMASRSSYDSSRGSCLILAWNGTGRYNPADCNHYVSFRTWHFLCKKRKLSEARLRADIREKSSRWVPVTFPDSGVRLSSDQHSNRGPGLPVPNRSVLCNFEPTGKTPPSCLSMNNGAGTSVTHWVALSLHVAQPGGQTPKS